MAIVFFVGGVIFWLVIAIMGLFILIDNLSEIDDENEKNLSETDDENEKNLSETDDENEKNLSETDDENEKKSCCFGCALILIISFLLVCFKVFGFLSGISFDPSDLMPEIRNPFH